MKNTKLGLKLPIDPRWVNLGEMDLGEILTDHAYCEQKATTACITLIRPHRACSSAFTGGYGGVGTFPHGTY